MGNYSVYKHTNKANGKVYIGIIKQKPENRWKNGNGYAALAFARAIKKYGWSSFKHEIICTGLSKEEACAVEKSLIKLYRATESKYGYNQALGGEGGGFYNRHHTQEAKEKISLALKAKGFSEDHKKHISEAKQGENHHLAKKVYQFDKCGEFIREWPYMSLAAKELGINKGNIGEVCNGHRRTAGGYVWRYEVE